MKTVLGSMKSVKKGYLQVKPRFHGLEEDSFPWSTEREERYGFLLDFMIFLVLLNCTQMYQVYMYISPKMLQPVETILS